MFLFSLDVIGYNKNIQDITIHGIEHKLCQFADDTTILLDGTEQFLNETLTVIKDFSNN